VSIGPERVSTPADPHGPDAAAGPADTPAQTKPRVLTRILLTRTRTASLSQCADRLSDAPSLHCRLQPHNDVLFYPVAMTWAAEIEIGTRTISFGSLDDVATVEPLWVGVHRVHTASMSELAPYVSDGETWVERRVLYE
jgi:hypothetical protein